MPSSHATSAPAGAHASEAMLTELKSRWKRLHQADREPWPDERLINALARKHKSFAAWLETQSEAATVAHSLQRAWCDFHSGEFRRAIKLGSDLGPLGACVANKAVAVESLNAAPNAAHVIEALTVATERGEQAVRLLPDVANVHYTLALVLGRYSQRISILKALAAGLAGRVREHLERALQLEPRHAEAHVALGLYHAEILNKLGTIAASLTYGVSRDAALEHLERAARLAPASPIVRIEHANGLLLIDGARYRAQAAELYAQAAACTPADMMEQLDVERARRGLRPA